MAKAFNRTTTKLQLGAKKVEENEIKQQQLIELVQSQVQALKAEVSKNKFE